MHSSRIMFVLECNFFFAYQQGQYLPNRATKYVRKLIVKYRVLWQNGSFLCTFAFGRTIRFACPAKQSVVRNKTGKTPLCSSKNTSLIRHCFVLRSVWKILGLRSWFIRRVASTPNCKSSPCACESDRDPVRIIDLGMLRGSDIYHRHWNKFCI